MASPLYADLRDLPPLRVLVGTDGGLHDDSIRLVENARSAGVDVEFEIGEEMVHIWPLFGFLPQAQESTDKFGKFLQKHLSSSTAKV